MEEYTSDSDDGIWSPEASEGEGLTVAEEATHDTMLEEAIEETMLENALADVVTTSSGALAPDGFLSTDALVAVFMESVRKAKNRYSLAMEACSNPKSDVTDLYLDICEVRGVEPGSRTLRFKDRKDLLKEWMRLHSRFILEPSAHLPPFTVPEPPRECFDDFFCPITLSYQSEWWLTSTGYDISGACLAQAAAARAPLPLKDPVASLPFGYVTYNVSKSKRAKAALSAFNPDHGHTFFLGASRGVPKVTNRFFNFTMRLPFSTETLAKTLGVWSDVVSTPAFEEPSVLQVPFPTFNVLDP